MEVGSTPSTPPPQNNSEDLPKCGISELISKTYPPFDHRADIIEPFDNEAKRDTEFQESEYMRLSSFPHRPLIFRFFGDCSPQN